MNFKRQKEYEDYLNRKKRKGFKSKKKRGKKEKSVFKSKVENRIQKLKEQQIKQSNPLENKVRKILEELEINFSYQQEFVNGNRFKLVDFYLPDFKLVVECDGSFHEGKEAKKKDEERTKWLIERTEGEEVVRVDYKQFFSHNKEESTEILRSYFESLAR